MKKYCKLLFIIPIVFMNLVSVASGKTPITTDSRIKTFVYNENEVFHVTLQYGYQSSIEFAKGEEVETISIGNSYSWKITPIDRRLFIKALEGAVHTNMTVITNRRTYQFELESKYPDGNLDEELVYVVRFFYPLESLDKPLPKVSSLNIDMSRYNPDPVMEPSVKKESYNFNYSLTGPDSIAPLKVFDDGQQTFMQFSNNNAVVPKIFSVEENGNENRVKYTRQGEYIVVKKIVNKMALRMNQDVVFVYNEG